MKKRKLLGTLSFWITYPGIFILLRNTHRSRVIICAGEKVLFVQNWLGVDSLSLPGGGIKKGESSIDAAVREVREETGIDIDPTKLTKFVSDLSLKELGIKYYADCYVIEVDTELKTVSRNIEILESIWLPWKEYINTKRFSGNTNSLLHAWLGWRHLVD